MSFNKHTDEIAITIPEFRMRKSADLGKNEIGIVTMAIDASGEANPTPMLYTNSFFIPKVKRWTWVKFGGEGRIVYGPKNPGSFVYYSVLFVESDQDVREFGNTVSNIFNSGETQGVIKALTAANPTASLVSTVVSELGKLVGKLLSENKNDLIFGTEGSFFRDLDPPYNIGDEFSTLGEHIECKVRVVPLVQTPVAPVAGLGVRGMNPLALEATDVLAPPTTQVLALEKLAGVPQAIRPIIG
jgi:hypothetical protein